MLGLEGCANLWQAGNLRLFSKWLFHFVMGRGSQDPNNPILLVLNQYCFSVSDLMRLDNTPHFCAQPYSHVCKLSFCSLVGLTGSNRTGRIQAATAVC